MGRLADFVLRQGFEDTQPMAHVAAYELYQHRAREKELNRQIDSVCQAHLVTAWEHLGRPWYCASIGDSLGNAVRRGFMINQPLPPAPDNDWEIHIRPVKEVI